MTRDALRDLVAEQFPDDWIVAVDESPSVPGALTVHASQHPRVVSTTIPQHRQDRMSVSVIARRMARWASVEATR